MRIAGCAGVHLFWRQQRPSFGEQCVREYWQFISLVSGKPIPHARLHSATQSLRGEDTQPAFGREIGFSP